MTTNTTFGKIQLAEALLQSGLISTPDQYVRFVDCGTLNDDSPTPWHFDEGHNVFIEQTDEDRDCGEVANIMAELELRGRRDYIIRRLHAPEGMVDKIYFKEAWMVPMFLLHWAPRKFKS